MKKLQLNRESVRVLVAADLVRVQGGHGNFLASPVSSAARPQIDQPWGARPGVLPSVWPRPATASPPVAPKRQSPKAAIKLQIA